MVILHPISVVQRVDNVTQWILKISIQLSNSPSTYTLARFCKVTHFKPRSQKIYSPASLGKIVTNRVKASNMAHIFLRAYKTNSEGVPRDPSIWGGGGGGVERKSIFNNFVTGQPGPLTDYLMAK